MEARRRPRMGLRLVLELFASTTERRDEIVSQFPQVAIAAA